MNQHQRNQYDTFKAMHSRPDAFVMANAWDAGSAKLLETLGFAALATTSAGLAFSTGKRDSANGLGREAILKNAADIVNAVNLPVSADLENGFGKSPEACIQTVQEACEINLAGGSIEDASGEPANPIFDFSLAVERISAVCEVTAKRPFLVTARAENFLHGRPDLDDTILRLQAFEKAGADVLYAPGLNTIEDIKLVCDSVSKPVNVVMGLGSSTFSVNQLSAAGVSRISVGGSFARAALGELMRAATEVADKGTFTYLNHVLPDPETTGSFD